MSVCTAGYKGEAPKGLVREKVLREREGVLQRDGYYREMGTTEGGSPEGLKYGEITERG